MDIKLNFLRKKIMNWMFFKTYLSVDNEGQKSLKIYSQQKQQWRISNILKIYL